MIKYTIGFISGNTPCGVLLTWTHNNKDIRFNTDQKHIIGEVVIIKQSYEIINGFATYKNLELLSVNDICVDALTLEYSYQSSLIILAYKDYISDEFVRRLESLKFSTVIIKKYLKDILFDDSIDNLSTYVSNIDIRRLISTRNAGLYEITNKDGDFSCYRLDCTDYEDNYLNRLLRVQGSYSPYCVNNSLPRPTKYVTLQQHVDKIIKDSEIAAEQNYSRIRHLAFLLEEVKDIQDEYLKYKEDAFLTAKKYMDYNSI